MLSKIKFILNNDTVETEINPAVVLLDYIRSLKLTGTKEGCKEGDCGACTVLAGTLSGNKVNYRSLNSCLVPIQNVSGKHIVTIEGLNSEDKELNPIQKAFAEYGASQCGFCTPGFIVSLTGYFLNKGVLTHDNVIDSLDGNICRCTGHNSIIRAAEKISADFDFKAENSNGSYFDYLIKNRIIPEYFKKIKDRLKVIQTEIEPSSKNNSVKYFIGNGTDLFVQKPEEMLSSELRFLNQNDNLKDIQIKDGHCIIGSTSSVTDILESEIIREIFPQIAEFAKLFGSTPIRNSATIGGNINNASPIGDMTAFFMALNSFVVLSDGIKKRNIPLNRFYKSYKITERNPDEFMESIMFKIPEGKYYFNFEKVSKRTFLDIASVNSALFLKMENELISEINISAGGVSAVPLYLSEICEFLTGKEINIENITEAVSISDNEISPISDARGSAEYKRLLLTRLIYSHFITLFPEIIDINLSV